MRRVVWLTDIHLNFLEPDQRAGFLEHLAGQRADALLISGDIGEAGSVEQYLVEMDAALGVPIMFVLGNHDFYNGSIHGVRMRIRGLTERSSRLVYLSSAGAAELAPDTCVIGHDGWGDARLGAYETSGVLLNDFLLIEELVGLDCRALRRKLEALGDEAAGHLHANLASAVGPYRHILLVTHVPPFRDACWYQDRISDDNWLPFFSCKAAGDVISKVMREHPDRRITVLCGHTHGSGRVRIQDNIEVITGGAQYGRPHVQQVFEF